MTTRSRPFVAVRVPAAIACGLAAFLACSPAQAGPWFHVWAGYCVTDAEEQGETPPAMIKGSKATPYGWYSWDAFAHAGDLTARLANAKATDLYASGRGAFARFVVDDLVLTDGTGVSKQVSYYVRLNVAGWATYVTGSGHSDVSCQVTGTVRVNAGTYNRWCPEGGEFYCSYPSSGAFTGMNEPTLSGTFQLGPFSAWTEIPQTLEVLTRIDITVGVAWPADNWIRGDAEMHSELPTELPAIVLPAGFQADSEQAGIVGSWYNPGLVAVGEAGAAPATAGLLQNTPNPFFGTTEITFSVAEQGPARLQVFDAAGRLVADLASEVRERGTHRVAWDGRDSRGQRAPAGVYFYRLEHTGGVETKRMTLLR